MNYNKQIFITSDITAQCQTKTILPPGKPEDIKLHIRALKDNWNEPLLNSDAFLKKFYQILLENNRILELGRDKAPVASPSRRRVLTNYNKVKAAIADGYEIRRSWDRKDTFARSLVVWDFDLHKLDDASRHIIYNNLVTFAVERDITLVRSKNYGLHIYFTYNPDCPFQQKNSHNRILRCFAPYVDILVNTGITCPDGDSRVVLYLSSSRWIPSGEDITLKNPVPKIILPLSNSEAKDNKLAESFPNGIFNGTFKGWRRRTLLHLMKCVVVSDDDIRIINNYFINPPKPLAELESEVLRNRPSGGPTGGEFSLNHYTFEYFGYLRREGKFAYFDSETSLWTIAEPDVLRGKIALLEEIDLEILAKHKTLILDYLKLNRQIIRKSDDFIIHLGKNSIKVSLSSTGELDRTIVSSTKEDFSFHSFKCKGGTGDKLKKIVSLLNSKDILSVRDIRETLREIRPKIYSFFIGKFSYEDVALRNSFTTCLLSLLMLLFLKNWDQFKDCTVQKIFKFVGPGGSGKSTALELLKLFVFSQKTYRGDLMTSSSGRFETNFIRNKSLLVFRDELLETVERGSRPAKRTLLKRLSGSDPIRYEVKYGGAGEFYNKGLVLITSNTPPQTNSKGDYASMKRRDRSFHFRRTLKIENQTQNLREQLFEEESLPLMLLAIKVSNNIPILLEVLKNWDSEGILLKANANAHYDAEVDPFLHFLHSITTQSTKTIKLKFISLHHLMGLFNQYILSRPESKIQVSHSITYRDKVLKYIRNYTSHSTVKQWLSISNLYRRNWRDSWRVLSEFKDKLISRRSFLPTSPKFIELRQNVSHFDIKGNREESLLPGFRDFPLNLSVLESFDCKVVFDSLPQTMNLENKQTFNTYTNTQRYLSSSTQSSTDNWLWDTVAHHITIIDANITMPALDHWDTDCPTIENLSEETKQWILETEETSITVKHKDLFEGIKLDKELFQKFPSSIKEELTRVTLECIFYQSLHFKHKEGVFKLTIAPLLQHILTLRIRKQHWLKFIKVKKLWDSKKRWNKRHDKKWRIQRERTRLEKSDTLKLAKMFLLEVLADFTRAGLLLEKEKRWTNGLLREVYVLPITRGIHKDLYLYMKLSRKPMVRKPINWVININGTPTGGGYFIAKKRGLELYHNENPLLQVKVKWDNDFVEKINFIQSRPYYLSIALARKAVNRWSEHLLELLNIRVTEKEHNIRRIKVKLWLLELLALRHVYKLSRDKKILKVYLPLQVDRVGRLHCNGILNINGSKFYRQILTLPEEEIEDQQASESRLQECTERRTRTTDKSCKNYTITKYLEGLKGKKDRKVVFVDATRSIIQIYSLLFADLKIRKLRNLGKEGPFDPVIEIRKEWPEVPEEQRIEGKYKKPLYGHLVRDRKYLKRCVMLLLYGSSVKGLTDSLAEDFINSDNIQNEKWKLYNLNLWVEKQIKKSFRYIYNVLPKLRGKQGAEINLHWQNNVSTYRYIKSDETELTIPAAAVKDAKASRRIKLEVADRDLHNTLKTNRTLRTRLLHSIDAAVAMHVRVAMYKKYKRTVYTVHDCFACEASLVDQLKQEYKKALFTEAFDKNPFKIVRKENREEEGKLLKRKLNSRWDNFRQEKAPHCLRRE